MKRKKVLVSFDSEGSSDEGVVVPSLVQKTSTSEAKKSIETSPSAGLAAIPRRKKYEWMDSEDDESGDGNDDQKDSGSDLSPHPSPAQVTLPASVSDIETFPEFVRVTPALKLAVGNMPPPEMTALFETATRLRFYDADLFQEVFKHLSDRLKKRELSIEQITIIAASMVELNAYDVHVFRAIISILRPLVGCLSKSRRLQWIKMLAAVGHSGDDDFMDELRMAPLPGGEAPNADDDFFLCWEFVRGGFCPRGSKCRWKHPPRNSTPPNPKM